MKKIGVMICILIAMFSLNGCGEVELPEVIEQSTIRISKEGVVDAYMADIFDKDYYQVSELLSMAKEEAAEYVKGSVQVVKAEMIPSKKDMVLLQYQFDSAKTYTDFMSCTLFSGTLQKAVESKYQMDVAVSDEEGETLLLADVARKSPDRMLVITDAKALIYCPKKATYVSSNAKICKDGSVDATAAEGTVYILLK